MLERGAGPELDLDGTARAANAAELLDAVIAQVSKRQPITAVPAPSGPARDLFGKPVAPKPANRGPKSASTPETRQAHEWGPISELTVETGPVEPVADWRRNQTDFPMGAIGICYPPRPGRLWASRCSCRRDVGVGGAVVRRGYHGSEGAGAGSGGSQGARGAASGQKLALRGEPSAGSFVKDTIKPRNRSNYSHWIQAKSG